MDGCSSNAKGQELWTYLNLIFLKSSPPAVFTKQAGIHFIFSV
jgi:hypothetical protein